MIRTDKKKNDNFFEEQKNRKETDSLEVFQGFNSFI